MNKTITLKGKIKDGKIIEILDEKLDTWIDEEVIIVIKRAKKLACTEEMLKEMLVGKDIGYVKINRKDIYRG